MLVISIDLKNMQTVSLISSTLLSTKIYEIIKTLLLIDYLPNRQIMGE